MHENTVAYICIGVTAVVLVWDLFLAVDDKECNTISEVVRTAAGKHPTIPFAFGFLMGHWFW